MPECARAVWFTAPGVVELRDEPGREPGAGEVVVSALASGISQGTEMLVLRGEVPPQMTLDLPTLEGSYELPIKFGYSSVGVVERVGPAVTGLMEGDLVFVHHPHQTRYVVPADVAVRLPCDLEPATTTLLANMETAVNIMLDARPRVGEQVIVFGLGVVGALTSLLMARIPGLTVFGVEPQPQRRAIARQLGLDTIVDTADEALTAVMQQSRGRGADLAVECSGAPPALDAAVRCCALEGRVVVASWYGAKATTLNLGGDFHRNRLRIISSQVGHIDAGLTARWSRQRRLAVGLDLLRSLHISPLITHRFQFEDAVDAYGLLQQQPGAVLHAVFQYGGEDV